MRLSCELPSKIGPKNCRRWRGGGWFDLRSICPRHDGLVGRMCQEILLEFMQIG
jgi:hypothetical protein